MQGITERLSEDIELLDRKIDKAAFNMRVACPGIIQTFDATKQTVTVKLSIRERLNFNGELQWQEIPLLVDVPIVVPRAGGYSLTLPIAQGDECLVVFGDMCIDAWYQSGGIQNQIDRRRHDLSDGFALIGCWSQPRKLSAYSTDSIQVRNDAGTALVEIKDTDINITTTGDVTVTAPQATVNASEECTISSPQVGLSGAWSGMRRLIDERFKDLFNGHKHGGIEPGAGTSGAPKSQYELVLDDHATTKTRAQ